MSEQPQELIDRMPGAAEAAVAPITPAPVGEKAAPITIENPGPQTLRTAIGSPYAPEYGANVHGGPVTGETVIPSEGATPQEAALGSQAVAGMGVENQAHPAPQGPETPQQ